MTSPSLPKSFTLSLTLLTSTEHPIDGLAATRCVSVHMTKLLQRKKECVSCSAPAQAGASGTGEDLKCPRHLRSRRAVWTKQDADLSRINLLVQDSPLQTSFLVDDLAPTRWQEITTSVNHVCRVHRASNCESPQVMLVCNFALTWCRCGEDCWESSLIL